MSAHYGVGSIEMSASASSGHRRISKRMAQKGRHFPACHCCGTRSVRSIAANMRAVHRARSSGVTSVGQVSTLVALGDLRFIFFCLSW